MKKTAGVGSGKLLMTLGLNSSLALTKLFLMGATKTKNSKTQNILLPDLSF